MPVDQQRAERAVRERVVAPDHQICPLPSTADDVQGALASPAAVAACRVDRTGFRARGTVLATGAGPSRCRSRCPPAREEHGIPGADTR